MSFDVSCSVLNHALMLISLVGWVFFNHLMIQVHKIIFFAYTKILQTGEMLLKVREAM